jgi:hypothetical protein
MFDHLEQPSQRWWLLTLLILWGVLLLGGFVSGNRDALSGRRMPTWTRMGSSLTLVLAAWSWFWFARHSAAESFSLLIALGMTLGCIGDFFMADLFGSKEPVLGGIAAFGLGHVAYITAILTFANRHGLNAASARWGALVAWLAIGLAGWYGIVLSSGRSAALRWAALPYALLLAGTAGLSTGLAWQAPALLSLALGSGLFLASDLILAGQLFRQWRLPFVGDVVWLTYGPGQMLIVYTVGSAMALGKSS